jgi:TolA-binding protein
LTAVPLTPAAADPPQPAAKDTPPAESYRKVLADFDTAQREFSTAYQAAKTDAERQKLVDEKYPDREKYAARMVAVANAKPDDPDSADAVIWAVSYTYQGTAHDAALKLLSERYAGSGKITNAVQRLAYSQSPLAPDALRKVIEANPSDTVKGFATFALGQNLMGHGKAGEAEKVFEDVVAKYGQVNGRRGTLADDAKGQLHEIRDLAIGKVSPDIEGEDVEGHKFKLSEYRGKVVVLDFWGDW